MTWRDLLQQAVADHKRGRAGVAEQIGVSRTALSLILGGKYPAKTDRIAAKVLDTYARIDCPHLGQTITQAQCRDFASRGAPTNSPRDMRHWRACQSCPLKPHAADPHGVKTQPGDHHE
jgi:hypothetical protein